MTLGLRTVKAQRIEFRILVQEALLLRMGLAIGDRLKIGEAEFLITGLVRIEPDRMANAFIQAGIPKQAIAIYPGLGDIGAAVQAVVEGAGMNVVRDLVGHGIGVGFHEEPQVPNTRQCSPLASNL